MSQNHPVEEFQFPMEILKYKTIKSWKHFNQLIKQENQHLRRDVNFQSTTITESNGSETISIQCKQCEAFFRYINAKKGEPFVLKDCNQMHKHILKQTHNFHQNIIERIEKFLQQDDGRQQKHELESEICINYRITSREFEQLYSQAAERLKRNTLLYDGKEIDELVKRMKSERFIVQCDYLTSKIDRESKTITKSVVVMNDLMQLNYKKYGDCCFIAVDDKRPMNRWHLGAIMGVNKQLELALFGIFLLKSPDADHLKGLLKIFFEKCQSKPLTIITQSHFFYDQAILQLKSENIIQSEHIYDYYTQSQKLHRHNPKLKRIFIELCRQPEKNKFFKRLEEIFNEDNFNQYDFDLEELAAQAHRVCISQIPPVPVGPYRSAKNVKSQKKYDYSIIRAFYKVYQDKQHMNGKNLTNKVMSIIKVLLEPIEQQSVECNRIMQIYPNLKQVRSILSKNVMDYLMNKAYATIQFRILKIDDQTYHIYEGRQQYLKVSKRNERWACECEESPKTMLPCVHEITVCCKTNYPMTTQLPKRWTNEDQRLEQEMKRKTFKKPRSKRVTLSEFLA